MAPKMMNNLFNNPLEIGLRILTLLEAAYPDSLDLLHLEESVYFIVHSNDLGGPPSLHPPTPMRTGEILVRRKILLSAISLMSSRNLLKECATKSGIRYLATDATNAFLCSLSSPYISDLRERAIWVIEYCKNFSEKELLEIRRNLIEQSTV